MKQRETKKRRKLDNTAMAFPVATGKKDSRVFRVYCELTEPVDPNLLQIALEGVILRYPLFQSVLKRGNFWFYFEKKELRPIVKEDENTPCSPIYQKNQETLLYEVTYRKNRINLEMYHALTDGTGAIQFLSDIVAAYLDLKYHITSELETPVSQEEQEEDSFGHYYSSEKQPKQIRKSAPAFQFKGRRLRQSDMKILECTMSAGQLLEKVREKGVSITVYITAVLLHAIAQGLTKKQKKKPVVVMIPVNLRNYYESKSMSNFFGWMEIEYDFLLGHTFAQILSHVKQRFSEDLAKDQVALRMNRLIRIEKNPLLSFVPLGLKNFFLKIGIWAGSRNVTAVFSNIGALKMPKVYKPYIKRFGTLASTDKLQICSCSYYDIFYFCITTKFADTGIEERMLSFLRQEGFQI